MDDEPLDKRPRKLDTSKCIICFGGLHGGQKGKDIVVKNPTPDGISTILKVSQKRNDEVLQLLSPFKDDIPSGKTKVSFHKSCRAKYTSVSNNCMPIPSELDDSTASTSTTDARRRYMRCEKLILIQTGTGESTRKKYCLRQLTDLTTLFMFECWHTPTYLHLKQNITEAVTNTTSVNAT